MDLVTKTVEGLSKLTTTYKEVRPDVLLLQFTIVNAFIVGHPRANNGEFALIDTGLSNSREFITKIIKDRFGGDSSPAAIILTHGHFDHVGSVIELAEKWDIPVYAHELEIPYITGKKDYPQGDPTVDEGLVAKLSPTFPHHSIDLGHRAVTLPSDGSVPAMPGWKWVHTPGHTQGHISLFREEDRLLIAGDAFTTTKQESLGSVLTQREKTKGPPAYLTTNWEAARDSIKRLKDLNPALVLPSHGKPMKGEELETHLEMLVKNFKETAVPNREKFLD